MNTRKDGPKSVNEDAADSYSKSHLSDVKDQHAQRNEDGLHEMHSHMDGEAVKSHAEQHAGSKTHPDGEAYEHHGGGMHESGGY